jgi:Flp pilus assembly pilin Flp
MESLLSRNAALNYMYLSLRTRIAKVRSGELERGASAVEWVVISMIVVGIVAAVGVVISTALKNRTNDVSTCIGSTTQANAGC